jgi:hypothetical protein
MPTIKSLLPNNMIQTGLCSRIVCCFLVFSFCCLYAGAQNTVKVDTIDLGRIKLSKKIRSFTLWLALDKKISSPREIASLPFSDTVPIRVAMNVTPALVEKDVYLRFTVENKKDTGVNYYFTPAGRQIAGAGRIQAYPS